VIDRECSSTAAELVSVSYALHNTVSYDTLLGRFARGQRVIAVALTTELETSIGESRTITDVDTFLDSHVIGARGLAGKCTGEVVVHAATGVLPFLGGSQVDEFLLLAQKILAAVSGP
jgi:hypothetical protein